MVSYAWVKYAKRGNALETYPPPRLPFLLFSPVLCREVTTLVLLPDSFELPLLGDEKMPSPVVPENGAIRIMAVARRIPSLVAGATLISGKGNTSSFRTPLEPLVSLGNAPSMLLYQLALSEAQESIKYQPESLRPLGLRE